MELDPANEKQLLTGLPFSVNCFAYCHLYSVFQNDAAVFQHCISSEREEYLLMEE